MWLQSFCHRNERDARDLEIDEMLRCHEMLEIIDEIGHVLGFGEREWQEMECGGVCVRDRVCW